MRSRLPDALLTILLDTEGEPDHAAMLAALDAADGSRAQSLIEARVTVQRAAAQHRRALFTLNAREKLITDEALKLLERLSNEEVS